MVSSDPETPCQFRGPLDFARVSPNISDVGDLAAIDQLGVMLPVADDRTA
jgi:hypothetical protein